MIFNFLYAFKYIYVEDGPFRPAALPGWEVENIRPILIETLQTIRT